MLPKVKYKHKYEVIYTDPNKLPEIVEADRLWNDPAVYSFLVAVNDKWDTVLSVPITHVAKVTRIS